MPDLFPAPSYLFFDTETTGLVVRGAAPEHPSQPHLVQLAAKLVDSERHVRGSLNVIVTPDGWTIPPAAAAVHGISDDLASRFGVPRRIAVSMFSCMARCSTHAVAHNFEFDYTVVSSAILRESAPNRLDSLVHVCTMQAATPLCKIPSPFRRGEYKWPRLDELHQFLFGEGFDGAHDALNDVDAMIRCYWEMVDRGYITCAGKAAA